MRGSLTDDSCERGWSGLALKGTTGTNERMNDKEKRRVDVDDRPLYYIHCALRKRGLGQTGQPANRIYIQYRGPMFSMHEPAGHKRERERAFPPFAVVG